MSRSGYYASPDRGFQMLRIVGTQKNRLRRGLRPVKWTHQSETVSFLSGTAGNSKRIELIIGF